MVRFLLALLMCLPLAGRAAQDFLEPEKAFRFTARAVDERTIEVGFDIARNYYMYREQFKVEAEGATLGVPDIPRGEVKFDENFGKNVETHRGAVSFRVPVQQGPASFRIAVTSQGCADAGLCYPPMTSEATVSLAAFGGDGSVRGPGGTLFPAMSTPVSSGGTPLGASDPDGVITGALASGRFWTVVAVFFGAGVLLSFTPCVLPMLPILSSIIVGRGAVPTRARGLALAGSYSLGMALVYTALGVAAGLAGEGLAAALQTPWVLGAFAVLLAVFALSMFGLYELRLPQAVSGGLSRGVARLRGGRLAGVFAMGGISALIVSPCVAAPLAGALVYLSQTRDVMLGGTALFALAAGMSVPLLLLGASAGAVLPKSGPWMTGIQRFFGVLLLGVAWWMVQPLVPSAWSLAGWGVLALLGAVLLWHDAAAGRLVWLRRTAGLALGAVAMLELLGAASGGYDPLQPLSHWGRAAGRSAGSPVTFQTVRNVAELDAAVTGAGRPVMLDFYADWCVSCKEMERYTFTDPQVRQQLSGFVLLKADVTQNNADDRELLRRFRLFGPPGTIFFDARGRELPASRVIGFQDASRFARTLQEVTGAH